MFFPSIVLNSLQSVLYPDPATKTALPKFTRAFHITKFRVNSVFFSLDLLGAFNVLYHSHILETVFSWPVGHSQDFPSHWWFLPSLAFPTSQQSRAQGPLQDPSVCSNSLTAPILSYSFNHLYVLVMLHWRRGQNLPRNSRRVLMWVFASCTHSIWDFSIWKSDSHLKLSMPL